MMLLSAVFFQSRAAAVCVRLFESHYKVVCERRLTFLTGGIHLKYVVFVSNRMNG